MHDGDEKFPEGRGTKRTEHENVTEYVEEHDRDRPGKHLQDNVDEHADAQRQTLQGGEEEVGSA